MRGRTLEQAKILSDKKGDFHAAFSLLLRDKLQFVIDAKKELNKETCTQIYTTIFYCLVEVLTRSNVKISNEAVNYVAQQYYDGIKLNDSDMGLDPNIFDQEARVENIPTKELALLGVMLKNTDFVWPIIEELKRQ